MDGPPGMFGMPRMMGPGMMGPGMMGPGMMMGQPMGGDFPPFQVRKQLCRTIGIYYFRDAVTAAHRSSCSQTLHNTLWRLSRVLHSQGRRLALLLSI